MPKNLQLSIKHKVLRYRAGKRNVMNISLSDLEVINFAKLKLRTCDHIEVSENLIRATKGTFILSIRYGRLVGVDKTSLVDVRLTSDMEKVIKIYAKKVVRFRDLIFDKYCARQVKILIDGFQN